MNPAHKGLSHALEAVLYRGQSAIYQSLVGAYRDALEGDTNWPRTVSALIREHTQLNVEVVLYPEPVYVAQLNWRPFDINHIFRNEDYNLPAMQGQQFNLEPYRSLIGNGKGRLYANGKVSGVFTKIPGQIWIGGKMLDGYFTAEELAAITLHEVGHMYTYFETMGRTMATALTIAQAEAFLTSCEDPAERRHAIEAVGKFLQFTDAMDVDVLAEPGKEKLFETVALRNAVATLSSDVGSHKLFNGEAEFLADSYAVRMGAAQPLVSANVKMAKHYHDPHTKGRLEHVLTEALKVAFFAVAGLHPLSAGIATLYGAYVLAMSRDDAINRNTPMERLEAVHADLVAISKDRRLPRPVIEQVVNDFNFVAGLREQLKDNVTFSSVVWSTLVPAHRRQYQQVQLERNIGRLVNNDIYVKAAHLSTLAS